MTSVSSPNTGAFRRSGQFRPASLGAIALVIAVGAAIAGGIIVTNDEATPAVATVTPSADTFTKQREGSVTNPTTNSADRAHLNRAPVVTTHSARKAPGNVWSEPQLD